MNIQLQICGLVIVIFLLILYRSHRRIELPGNRIFMCMLIMIIACISFDAISVVAIFYSDALSMLTVKTICRIYLISMVWVGWIDFCYVSLDLSSNAVKHKRSMIIMAAVSVVESVLIAVLPISIFNSNGEIYTYGPAVIATYVFTLFYILSVLSIAVYVSKWKSSRRGMAVILTTSLWLLAAAIQALNNAYLVVGFSMAVGAMILYIVMENPDANLDKQLGCFNSYAFYRYLAAKTAKGEKFSLLEFSVTDINALENRDIDVAQITKKVVEDFENTEGLYMFKNMSASIVAISESKEILEDVNSAIMKVVSGHREISDSIVVVSIDDVNRLETANEIVKFLTHVRNDSSRLSATVHVTEDMVEKYKDSKKVEQEIDLALEEDRVEVFLQPICRKGEKIVPAAEALVRIRNRDGSLLSPGAFIPVAELTGQVGKLGERVLEKVCQFLRDSDAVKLGLGKIDVNLSAVQCDDVSTAGTLSGIVDKYGISPNLVNFEITETAVSSARDVLLENMNNLVAKGFSFALDDFGKGESNLIYIVEMPVNVIKLDMDMSKAFFKVPKAKYVVEAIIEMAHRLDMPVVAEGIESKDELDRIVDAGVDFIQGYYYSRPLPMDEFIEYLKTRTEDEPEEGVDTAPEAAESELIETAESGRDLTGKRILIVEDNEMNSEIAQDILEDFGFETDTAEDGSIAVEKVVTSKPGFYDLILMDIRMPIMDGYEATRRIRAIDDEALSSIPIVALTASNKDEDKNKALASGMNQHMVKPIDPPTLYRIIEKLI